MANTSPTVILIGLRASGKTTVAHLLSAQTGRPMYDLDDLSAANLGVASPAEALRQRGEPAFREAEFAALQVALKSPPCILALGGGTPTFAPSLELLTRARSNRRVTIVYLKAQPVTLVQRLLLTDLSTRPSLTGEGVLEEVSTLFDRRDPVYTRLASFIVECDRLSAEQSAEFILNRID